MTSPRRNPFHSPLRYPGGKTKLAPFIKALIYENKLVGRDYVELYAGGAGVALSLLFEEYVSTVTINDFDPSVYAFWHSVINENERFCKEIEKIPVDIETWLKQRDVQRQKDSADLFPLGFSTFYLNRTNVSGVLTGGVIGGMEQQGKYKIDARFNKCDLIQKVKRIGRYRDRINVTAMDGIKMLSDGLKKGAFVYLDPPYVKKAKQLYMNSFDETDHESISEALLGGGHDFIWLLSYDQHELIENLYRRCKNKISWNLSYGTSNRRGRENIFFHPKLKFRDAAFQLPTRL